MAYCEHMPTWFRRNLLQVFCRFDSALDSIIEPRTLALKHAFVDFTTDPSKTREDFVRWLVGDPHFVELLTATAFKAQKGKQLVCDPYELVGEVLAKILPKWVQKNSFKLRGSDHRAFVTWLETIRYRMVVDAFKELCRQDPALKGRKKQSFKGLAHSN